MGSLWGIGLGDPHMALRLATSPFLGDVWSHHGAILATPRLNMLAVSPERPRPSPQFVITSSSSQRQGPKSLL